MPLTWRDDASLFGHALQVTQDNHVAHINLGVALARQGELEEAAHHLTEAASLSPGSAHAWGVRGEVRLLRGRPEQARDDFERALLLADGSRWRLGMARALRDLGDPGAATAQLRAAIALDPEDGELHGLLGVLLAERGDD